MKGSNLALSSFIAMSAVLQAQAQTVVNVKIENYAFSPAETIVKVGTTVVFINLDRLPHSVIGTLGNEVKFRSQEQLDEDEPFEYVAYQPGEITVTCGLHSGMKGRLKVTE
jgi:plastocyanin